MTQYWRNLIQVFKRYQPLLVHLVERDFKVKYRRSTLGIVWSILNPFLMMLVITAVFSTMFKQSIEYFPAYLLCGQVMFNFYSEATSTAMDSVLGSSALIKKVYIPKYIFPLEKVVFSLVNTLFSLVALVVVVLVVGVPLTPWVLLFPVPIALLFVFNLGVGMMLSCLVIFFRDIKHLYGIVVLILTYMTPIFYPVSLLSATMQEVIKFNPMYWYVGMFRQVIIEGTAPTQLQWVLTCAWGIAALLAGLFVMKKTQDRFILFM